MVTGDDREVVRGGVWMYDGVLPLGVRIFRASLIYGSGDHEDPSDLRDDRSVPCFGVEYEGIDGWRRSSTSLGGSYLTLEAAMVHVEEVCPGVVWREAAP